MCTKSKCLGDATTHDSIYTAGEMQEDVHPAIYLTLYVRGVARILEIGRGANTRAIRSWCAKILGPEAMPID